MLSNGAGAGAAEAGAAGVPPTYEDLAKQKRTLQHQLVLLVNAVFATARGLQSTQSLANMAKRIEDKFLPDDPDSNSEDSADEIVVADAEAGAEELPPTYVEQQLRIDNLQLVVRRLERELESRQRAVRGISHALRHVVSRVEVWAVGLRPLQDWPGLIRHIQRIRQTAMDMHAPTGSPRGSPTGSPQGSPRGSPRGFDPVSPASSQAGSHAGPASDARSRSGSPIGRFSE